MFVLQVADDRAPGRPEAAVETAPRWRRCLFPSLTCADFQVADLIEFNRLKPRISDWQRITGHDVPDPEMVFGVSALPHAEEKLSI